MDKLLNKIEELIDAYNELPNAKKVALIPKEYANAMNLPLIEKTNNVSDFYIGLYGEDGIGLFKELRFYTPKRIGKSGYEEWKVGSIYKGVESKLLGILITHRDCFNVFEWQKQGAFEVVDSETYVCNCDLHSVIAFEDMRTKMYNDGEIGPYKLGEATEKEIIDVLSYACEYYKDKIIVQPTKIK